MHLDVMDGHFVPNLTIGPPIVKWLRPVTDATFDVHLMIENPDLFIPEFSAAGANWISVHQEACVHLHRTIELIAHHGCKPGVVINPATPVEMLTEVLDMVNLVMVMSVNPGFGGQKFIHSAVHKIAKLARIRQERRLNFRIEVDGGIAHDTIADTQRLFQEFTDPRAAFLGHPGICMGTALGPHVMRESERPAHLQNAAHALRHQLANADLGKRASP